MLEPLVKYAERRGLGDDPCFEARHVKWAIVLHQDGRFQGITVLGDPEDKRWKGKLFRKAPRTPNTYEAPGCQGQKTPFTKKSSSLGRRRVRK